MDIATDCKQNLSNEIYRLETFVNFPSDVPVCETTLARAGFFYTGYKDQVKCFSCGGTIENWQHGDSAVRKHRQLFPTCPFINGLRVNEQVSNSSFPVVSRAEFAATESQWSTINGPSRLNSNHELSRDPVRSGSIEDMSHLRPRNPAMCSEAARLKTFTNWPSYGIVTPRELAKAGLYYIGKDDQVQCFCCGGFLKNWEPGDRTMSEHKRHFPMCSFVSGLSVGNVPIDSNCGTGDVNQHLNDEPKASFFHLPKHPEKQSFNSRLQTFKHGMYFPLDVEDLAGAGFYSTGDGDNVKCFHCDGGLRNWEPGDKAWEQHAKWFPGCAFLIQQRGHDFVNDVQLKKLHLNSTNQALPQDGQSALRSESAFSESSLMQSPAVLGALEMGFDKVMIMQLVKKKLESTCETYNSVEALVGDLLALEGKTQDQKHEEQKEVTNVEEQLKKLKEEKSCKICWDRDVCIAFLPCGHIATCKECSSVKMCPICCSKILERVRIYMA
ncbi:E3 ubiquitin-protein ligase XIAP-like isoform X2 [Pristis pectinata]|uniref:E3 ubiquitin-protein ligase XIAP-like isoform X2 n=1 Tax=Pristis pectinata TaxID=685728 RepID=UPI00223D245A|nr:E3 ubiquitin-protein ligase XIAP-like isoform X2 [Pristis pectinata]